MEKSNAPRSRATTKKGISIDEKPCISKESLSNINVEKSLIADMRPARRKIKWNSAVSDWDRRGDHTSTRIKVGIDLEELQFLGGVPLIQPQKDETVAASSSALEGNYTSVTDFRYVEGDAVEVLEKKINRTYDTIKRIVQENESLDKEVDALETENQALRQGIAAVPMGKNPTRKGLDQLCALEKRLRKKVREMDRQAKLLKRRRNEIERTKRRTRSEDANDDAKSYSTQTSKSISTFVDNDSDEEDEDVVVFSTGVAVESDSDFESSLSEGEEVKIEEAGIDEVEENEEASLGSFKAAEEDELSAHQSSHLGDSLKDLPYEPSISIL